MIFLKSWYTHLHISLFWWHLTSIVGLFVPHNVLSKLRILNTSFVRCVLGCTKLLTEQLFLLVLYFSKQTYVTQYWQILQYIVIFDNWKKCIARSEWVCSCVATFIKCTEIAQWNVGGDISQTPTIFNCYFEVGRKATLFLIIHVSLLTERR